MDNKENMGDGMMEMLKGIIQHHERVDFEGLFEKLGRGYVGIDREDVGRFLRRVGVKHSFVGRADGVDRIRMALNSALEPVGGVIPGLASAALLAVVRSPEAAEPLLMSEMQGLSDFFAGSLPPLCEIVWCLADDDSLGDMVEVVLLVNCI